MSRKKPIEEVQEPRTGKAKLEEIGYGADITERKRADTIRRQIMKKLGIDSIAGLTIYAIVHGIISLDF